jgi:tuberculosinol/isotuberculosinol synthase
VDLETFQNLPTEEVARLVREDGPKVCVFPVNGTRRWLMLEHPDEMASDFVGAYLQIVGRKYIELFSMFFDHGVHTLLSPFFGPDLLERKGEYLKLVSVGLSWFAESEKFLTFYDDYGVRVRVYGDIRRYFPKASWPNLQNTFDQLAKQTASYDHHRLFIGICAHDATETVAEIGMRFYEEHGRLPDRHEIVEVYYGEYVGPVDLFIGSDRPSSYDMPLVATGIEDLYFTVAPSPYLDVPTLRAILYDHMYARRVSDESYHHLSMQDRRAMAELYALNRHRVLGLGRRHASGCFWYPVPQVMLPPHLLAEKQGDQG